MEVVFIKFFGAIAHAKNIVHGVVPHDYWNSYSTHYNTTYFKVVHAHNCDMYL